jgi:aspartate kinase
MKVLKFGGTSVGSPERIEQLLPIIRSQAADKHLVVLSAVSGTTNDLVTLSELYAKKEDKAVQKHIDILYDKYKKFVKELFKTESGTLEALALLTMYFSYCISSTVQVSLLQKSVLS